VDQTTLQRQAERLKGYAAMGGFVISIEQAKRGVLGAEEDDALLMSPLMLHSSAEAVSPIHRRIIHLEYAASRLPTGLQWIEKETSSK
jgi:hypothetical protein